jgi:hypothetical protein
MTFTISNVRPSPFDARDYHFTPTSAGPLPRKIDLRQFISDKEYQGIHGSCVAHAAVAVVESMTKRAGKWEDLSRRFPYFTGRELCGLSGQDGMFPRAVLEAGRKFGFCLESECEYVSELIDVRPDAAAFESAKKRKILRYERVPLDHDNFMVSVNNIKWAMNEGHHVKVAMKIGRDMFRMRGPIDQQNYISFTSGMPGFEYVCNHDVDLVMYDDDLRYGSFCFDNWWDGWGDERGHGAFSYTIVKDFIEAWIIKEIWGGISLVDPAKHDRQTKVAQLYAALFGRAPEREGMTYWTQQIQTKTFAQVAQEMYNTDPARVYYPYTLTNEQIISRFYANVLGRQADAGGLAYWTAELNSGMTPGQVVTNMLTAVANYSGADPMGLMSQRLLSNKVTIGLYYAVDLAGNNVSISKLAFDRITDAPELVDAARDHIIQLTGWTGA